MTVIRTADLHPARPFVRAGITAVALPLAPVLLVGWCLYWVGMGCCFDAKREKEGNENKFYNQASKKSSLFKQAALGYAFPFFAAGTIVVLVGGFISMPIWGFHKLLWRNR